MFKSLLSGNRYTCPKSLYAIASPRYGRARRAGMGELFSDQIVVENIKKNLLFTLSLQVQQSSRLSMFSALKPMLPSTSGSKLPFQAAL